MIHQDLGHLISVFLPVVAALLPIVNPIGSAPRFLALTLGADSSMQAGLARDIAINSFLLLMASLIVGNFVLRVFGLSVPVVQLAAGLVLCWLGAKILTADESPATPVTVASDQEVLARAFYPLTLPVTVDTGAISAVVTLGANHSHDVQTLLMAVVGASMALVTIAATVCFAYRYAEPVSRWLGHSRMMAVLRLSAFIVLCIGVQIAWNGVKALIEELPR